MSIIIMRCFPSRIIVLTSALLVIAASLLVTEYFLPSFVPKFEHEPSDQEECTPDHVSATSYEELVTPSGSNASMVVRTLQKHGLSFFENLLSQEEANKLRAYILKENKKDRYKEDILEEQNRAHITFGIDEDPLIYNSVHSVLTKQPLRGVLEELVGPDASLMELASITSYPGATGQNWHKDTFFDDNIVDMYTIFIPLQKTTREMGATSMCAGTHQCMDAECDEWDKTLYASVNAGTGALMNSQLYHRGSANTLSPDDDDDDEHARVMFYMSWAESPTRRRRPKENQGSGEARRKIPPAGGTYAIRFSQTGRTMSQIIHRSWSVFSSIDFWSSSRGWNFIELASVKFAEDVDIGGLFSSDVDRGAEYLWRVGLVLLVVYAFMAEREIVHLRRKNKPDQQQQQHSNKQKGE